MPAPFWALIKPGALLQVWDCVPDTEVGLQVPTYEIENIFEPFRRLHGDRLHSDRGSGLGLSIVRVIAEAHGGTVVARPRDEGGLTITAELPTAGP